MQYHVVPIVGGGIAAKERMPGRILLPREPLRSKFPLHGGPGSERRIRCDPSDGVICPEPQRDPLALMELGDRKPADGTRVRLAMGGSRQPQANKAQKEGWDESPGSR